MRIFLKKFLQKIKKSRKQFVLALACFVVLIGITIGLFFLNRHDDADADTGAAISTPPPTPPRVTPENRHTPTPEPEETPEPTPEPLDDGIREPDREIDFDELFERNEDVFAWIYVPGTIIDYPIVKSEDNYDYLYTDIDGRESEYGMIMMDMANSIDFSDPVTVIYGHRMNDDKMFAQLLKFDTARFFEENREFMIYTPEGMRTYDIIAAYYTGDANVLAEYDFYRPLLWRIYIESIYARERANLFPYNIGNNDNMVTLMTCQEGSSVRRFVVHGILRRDYPDGYESVSYPLE